MGGGGGGAGKGEIVCGVGVMVGRGIEACFLRFWILS